jgi:A/G-specific adenine glycosylase
MLQQTRVETVIPYFERFLARYPDVKALAGANLDDVLSLWSGLGYYRRARELHAAAREVTERYGGSLPSEAGELQKLSGIGAYTAGAIASIAFGRVAPLVDGNVARVLARVEGIDLDIRSTEGSRALWATAARLVPSEAPGRFNEALMELGATTCTPRDPRCLICPIRKFCSAAATGRQGELPVVAEKKKVPVVAVIAAVIHHGSSVFMARRAEGGLFGGLWEPPMVEAPSLEEALSALSGAGIDMGEVDLRKAGRVRHILTHKEMNVLVVTGEARSRFNLNPSPRTAPYERADWLDPSTAGVGISTLARKILKAASRAPDADAASDATPRAATDATLKARVKLAAKVTSRRKPPTKKTRGPV